LEKHSRRLLKKEREAAKTPRRQVRRSRIFGDSISWRLGVLAALLFSEAFSAPARAWARE
jgi:hypothetical protein